MATTKGLAADLDAVTRGHGNIVEKILSEMQEAGLTKDRDALIKALVEPERVSVGALVRILGEHGHSVTKNHVAGARTRLIAEQNAAR